MLIVDAQVHIWGAEYAGAAMAGAQRRIGCGPSRRTSCCRRWTRPGSRGS